MIRSEAYWKVRGMYEFFFMHSEEIDLCWRLIAEGNSIVYCPTSQILHLGGGSLAYQSPRKTYFNFRNNIIMCFRNLPWYVLLWFLPTRFILDIVASVKFLLDGDRLNCLAVLKAHRDFLKWIIFEKNKFPPKKKSLWAIPVVLRKSIVWEYYIRGIKYYTEIKKGRHG
jgi:GT2 family glycosyltransferase